MSDVDLIRLNFNPASLFVLNIVLGFIMFGISLSLKIQDFRYILKVPKAFFIGIISQFFLLPLFSYFLILIIRPHPSFALGMMLVASCPGGNISNFLTFFARGNVALSVSMTAFSTILAIFLTPLNFHFWSSLIPELIPLLKQLSINPIEMILNIFLLLGIPLISGLWISHRFPGFSNQFTSFIKYFSLIFFALFVLGALTVNFKYFIKYIRHIFALVLLQNFLAFLSGYLASRIFKITDKEKRAITIEVGIQNSGLGLILIFNFFEGIGGMALIAAWWGIWHIIAGLSLAYYWNKKG